MKAAYEAMGRLDEGKRVAALNDVDIYLRAREAGYRNIWKPYVELYHYESAIRRPDTSPVKYARFEQEGQYIRDRWSGVLENDPAYSLNLTLDCGDVSYAWPHACRRTTGFVRRVSDAMVRHRTQPISNLERKSVNDRTAHSIDKKPNHSAALVNDGSGKSILSTNGEALVVILLSTFNGERYLREQLESIADQSYQNWQVFWRDDGSSDRSREIMETFAKRVGCSRCVEIGPRGARLGAAKSFFALLKEAEGYRLVAFADQDDVWLPDKLQRAADRLMAQTPGVPALYCGRQAIVGERLERQGLSPLPHFGPGFPSALLQNIVTGCTAMLNQEAVRLVNSVPPPDNTVHDWWSYIVVAAAGGHIIFDPTPVILYRQHGHNAIGAISPIVPRAIKALRRGARPFLRQLEEHVVALEASEGALVPSARMTVWKIRRALSRGRMARIGLMREAGFRRQTRLENIGMAMWMLASYNPKTVDERS